MAAKSGQMSQIELLLVYGANLTVVDSREKTAIDYAREAGHNDIVNRLVEHQFDIPDALTRFICQGRQPNHRNGEHFLFVDIKSDFLNILDNQNDTEISQSSVDLFRKELHQSIQSLSHKSFQELSRDIYDEIDRREINSFVCSYYANENGKLHSQCQQLVIPFLPVYQFFSSTRNQGRQKLALLNTKEITLLIVDVLNEIRRRVYGLSSLSTLKGELSTNVDNEFDDDDSEPLYDSVPSEGDYDECNEIVSSMPKMKFIDRHVSSKTLVTSNNSGSFNMNKNKDYVSMGEYSIMKEQMIKSTNLMEEFLNENKEMRVEMARLQSIVEKLVEENVQLRQLIIPSKNNSLNSLNYENKSNSVLLDSFSEQFNRNSYLRGSNRVRPQSVTGSNSTTNCYSGEGITMKSPSVVSHSLSQSPSKTSNSSLINFQSSQQNNQQAQMSNHFSASTISGAFVNSSNSSTSSLSSQTQANQISCTQQSHAIPPTPADMIHQSNYSGHNSTSKGQHTSLSKSNSANMSAPFPSKDDIIKKIEFITNGIKELLSNAREGKHEEYVSHVLMC